MCRRTNWTERCDKCHTVQSSQLRLSACEKAEEKGVACRPGGMTPERCTYLTLTNCGVCFPSKAKERAAEFYGFGKPDEPEADKEPETEKEPETKAT